MTAYHIDTVTRFGLKRDLNWFPNSKRVTKLLEAVLSRYYWR